MILATSQDLSALTLCYNNAMKAIIIEDDEEEQEFLRKGLSEIDYLCDVTGDGAKGFEKLLNGAYDLAIVDLMLPKMDGKEIIRKARAAGVSTPIVIVSALGSISDRVAGLSIGADAYMPKPCSMDELKARLVAFNRRFKNAQARVLDAHGISIDTVSHTCRRNGRSIELSKIEFAMLECLMRHRGGMVTKDLLIEQAWGYDAEPSTDIIPPHISRLRAKLNVGGEEDPIENRRGLGYVFKA